MNMLSYWTILSLCVVPAVVGAKEIVDIEISTFSHEDGEFRPAEAHKCLGRWARNDFS